MLLWRLVNTVTDKKKKIVFVIVEGPSDETALGLFLNKIYNNQKVFIEVVHGDITSQNDVNSSNIVTKINNIIKSYMNNYHVNKNDFQEIVHLVDMDGAFIDDEKIVYDGNCDRTIYSETCIRTDDVENILKRNIRKRGCINRICSLPEINGIKYQVYYMSCNLDHVLFNKLNIDDDEKRRSAYYFVRKYRNDLEGFIGFVSNSAFSINGDYIDSWDFIKKELHSLERHTNFGICISRALNHKE